MAEAIWLTRPITFSGLNVGPRSSMDGDRLALDELHGQVRQPALLADVEQGDDVRVRERPGDPGLVVEALDEGLVLRALRAGCPGGSS